MPLVLLLPGYYLTLIVDGKRVTHMAQVHGTSTIKEQELVKEEFQIHTALQEMWYKISCKAP